jgi:hypothetical protein
LQTAGVAPSTAPISTPDFANRVIMSDMFDVQAAKIAEHKGESSDRTFESRTIITWFPSSKSIHATVIIMMPSSGRRSYYPK